LVSFELLALYGYVGTKATKVKSVLPFNYPGQLVLSAGAPVVKGKF
jgi:hypothetical protein